jgi:hypothetical protein
MISSERINLRPNVYSSFSIYINVFLSQTPASFCQRASNPCLGQARNLEDSFTRSDLNQRGIGKDG